MGVGWARSENSPSKRAPRETLLTRRSSADGGEREVLRRCAPFTVKPHRQGLNTELIAVVAAAGSAAESVVDRSAARRAAIVEIQGGDVCDGGAGGRAVAVEIRGPLLMMVALAAELLLLKLNEPVTLLVMAAEPAVLALKKLRMLELLILALPAVLVISNCRVPRLLLMASRAGGAVVVEIEVAVVADGGVPGRAVVVKIQNEVVGDGGAAAVNDDAGTSKNERPVVGESVGRGPGVERPASNRCGDSREPHRSLVGHAESSRTLFGTVAGVQLAAV